MMTSSDKLKQTISVTNIAKIVTYADRPVGEEGITLVTEIIHICCISIISVAKTVKSVFSWPSMS